MFHLYVEIDGLVRKLDTLADNAEDLDKPLKRFGGYLRARAAERYAAQDFVPLAPATIKKREARGLKNVERKLKYSLKKALTAPSVRATTKARREALLAEFQQRHRRGQLIVGPHVPLTLKQMTGISAKVDKAVAKAVSAPILGKLAKSLKTTINEGSVTLASLTKGGWSAVHNDGDGHVPQRQTIRVEEQDLKVLVDLLREHLLMGQDV